MVRGCEGRQDDVERIWGDAEAEGFAFRVNCYWAEIPRHYENVELDEFVIMPNHVHGIINIVGTGHCSVPTKRTKRVSISQIMEK